MVSDGLTTLNASSSDLLQKNTLITFTGRSADVIHRFYLPSEFNKMDLVPGRISNIILHINNRGVYYGTCAEICGANHAFMPFKFELL